MNKNTQKSAIALASAAFETDDSQSWSAPAKPRTDILSILDELNALKSKPLNGIVKVEGIHIRPINKADGSRAYALDGRVGERRISSYYSGQVGIDRLSAIMGLMSAQDTDTLQLRARTKSKEGREFLDLDV